MHTIKLKVGDGIYNHLMFFLKNLKTNELEIIEDKKINNSTFAHKTELFFSVNS